MKHALAQSVPVVAASPPLTPRVAEVEAILERASPSEFLRAIELSTLAPDSLRARMLAGERAPAPYLPPPAPAAPMPVGPATWRSSALTPAVQARVEERLKEEEAGSDLTRYQRAVRRCSRSVVEQALAEAAGNKAKAARELGLSRVGLYKILGY
jgi:DNA-binding NtrC family response regulator